MAQIPEELNEVVSTLSHEMRSPVAIMKGALENLRHDQCGELNDLQNKMVNTAVRQCDRLLRMIQNLLELGRLNAEQMTLRAERLPVLPLLEQLAGEFSGLVARQGLQLEIQCAGEVQDLRADSDLVTQLLHNLLGNALRFARHVIRIQALPQANCVLLIVSDDGAGIPAEKIEQLFGAFVQAERVADAAGYKGTGLGLAICRKIIDLHHGQLWVESRVGHGAAFHCVLPAATVAAAVSAPQTPPALTPASAAAHF